MNTETKIILKVSLKQAEEIFRTLNRSAIKTNNEANKQASK